MLEEILVLKSDFRIYLKEPKGSTEVSQTYERLRYKHIGLNLTVSSNQKQNLFLLKRKVDSKKHYIIQRPPFTGEMKP